MEKLSRPWDKEHMRMAMLEQEETFKEQVYELHRLYRIQKILMKNIEASRAIGVSQLGWDFKNAIGLTQNDHHKGTQEKPTMKFNLEGLDLEDMTESDSGRVLNIINEREIELTLGPSRYSHKNNQTPLTIDSGHIWSSSSAGSNLINKTICRNHHRTYTTREELSGGIIGLAQVPESTSGYKSGMRNSYDIEEQSRQGRSEQSPWLLQVLSLKMT